MEFTINDEDYASLKDSVIVVTGCSSGMGLETTKILLNTGAFVIGGDLNPAPLEHSNFKFLTTSVDSWSDLSALFKLAIETHGRVDHVFANAGITGRTNYLDEKLDNNGELQEPDHLAYDIMMKGVINTGALALHYMRKQESGGSIVITASASSFQRFRAVDYATCKHGVLGYMRGMTALLEAQGIPIRFNCIAPSWTRTGMLPPGLLESIGKATQSAEVPARSVALLMADKSRQGQMIYSWHGRYKEIEEILLKGAEEVLAGEELDDLVMGQLQEKLLSSAETN